MPRQFEALTDCPSCKSVMVHWLRTSVINPDLDPDCRVEVFAWGNLKPKRTLGVTYDEREFEVMRQCRSCGREWGEV